MDVLVLENESTFICSGESEDQKEIAPDQSPDISLSSGPIEPLGTEKDSGSDPESNDHDITPTHHYSLKDQQEWLKSHLKTATTEKNRLEEITAHLMEKAERLQYELADAREATKSRDEVIKLLQEQLARMEVAYTKSLEESVQSKLQLSSHEQEILHLKEICYKYEEEENKEIAEAEVNSLVKLESKIKRLEGENEKMKEEIVHLKGEKTSLAKRLKEVTESDQRQRWKERCEEEEEKNRDNVQNESNSKITNGTNEREKMLKELNVELEKKISSMAEENKELNSKVQMLLGEVESEKKIMSVKKEMSESVCEMKKKNLEMEAHVKHLEKEIEEKKVLNVREKEKEIEFLVKQFSQEKELLIKFYERKLVDRAGEDSKLKDTLQRLHDLVGDLEVKYSKETVQDALKNELFELRDQCDLVSKSVAEMQNRDNHDVNFLLRENINLQKEINEIKISLPKDDQVIDFKEKYVALACENVKMKNVILELKNQVNSLTVLVNSESRSQGATKSENSTKQSENENVCVESSRRRKGVEMGNHLAWRNLYGIKKIEKSHGWKPERSDEGEIPGIRPSVSDTTEKLEMLRLKKKVALLQDKISGEKAMREALETQISEINRDLKEKGSLEQEVLSLKRKLNREHLQKLDLELAQYQKELQGKREKYLEEVSKSPGIDEYREKCEMLAKEREKSKEIRNKILEKGHIIQEHGWSPSMASTQHEYPTISLAEPELRGLHPQFGPLHSSTCLEPEIKHHLEKELERSIRKYKAGTSTTPTVTSSNLRVDLLKETEST
ncbi:hypothetical protein RUM44_013307 [Polyplax serrata]|uniref:Uncharacterized protein n=1 Tax=Polyplax serrata TaxID=468196 RepID=A0ABR1BI03_POLSC